MAETNITERFEFLTDIITSYDGKEQRIRLREHPRHFVSYDYDAMNSSEAQWLKAQLRMRSTDIYYIPMWHNISYLSEDFKTGKSLYIEKEYMYNFRHCDAIEIFFRDGVFSSPNIQKVVFGYGDGIYGTVVKSAALYTGCTTRKCQTGDSRTSVKCTAANNLKCRI